MVCNYQCQILTDLKNMPPFPPKMPMYFGSIIQDATCVCLIGYLKLRFSSVNLPDRSGWVSPTFPHIQKSKLYPNSIPILVKSPSILIPHCTSPFFLANPKKIKMTHPHRKMSIPMQYIAHGFHSISPCMYPPVIKHGNGTSPS